MKRLLSIATLALATTAPVWAQELPDAPLPAASAPVHYDRQLWIATGVNGAAKVADVTQECLVLSRPGGYERWLPQPHNCGGVTMWIAIDFGASYLASRWLVKHNHHKAAVWLQYVNAGGNVAGFAYTRAHWNSAIGGSHER